MQLTDLFDLSIDPDEHTNVIRSQLEVSRRLRALLASKRARAKLPPF